VLAALDRDPHGGLLTPEERRTLEQWIRASAPAFRGSVHSPGIVDPRSNEWHGKVLRDRRWAPMLDAADSQACGRCHDGAPVRPAGVTLAAPGATACTSCHTEPAGVLACNTCHGSGARTYPPRDKCFFPEDKDRSGAHAAHVESSPTHQGGFACSTCHPVPDDRVIGGLHGNGSVEVVFDRVVVAGEASYDRTTKTCAVDCHDRGGARPRPAWNDAGRLTCNDCHRAPPERHPPGACSKCHGEADATGASLRVGTLHMNGKVDLGDGSGKCGACHGRADDPWPQTGAHAVHESPTLTTPIECDNCHTVPPSVMATGHLDGIIQVAFGGRALARGAHPTWDGRTCSGAACHGAALRDAPTLVPEWASTMPRASCTGCHGIPPTQHTASTSCDRSTCHGVEVARDAMGMLSITNEGKLVHVDGAIQAPLP
jgi:predicted CxxxxCH...CXXCH cytochrome family protein